MSKSPLKPNACTGCNGQSIRYAYDEDGNRIAQYHNNDTTPYIHYTYTDGELTQMINSDTGLKYVYSENGKVDVYKTSDNTLVHSYYQEDTENEVTLENSDDFEYDVETGETYNIPQRNPASYTTVEGNCFGFLYTSVTSDKRIRYTFGTDELEYGYKTKANDDEDGKPTDNSKGSPPNYAKKNFKKQTGWDWDAKAKAYEKKKKEKEKKEREKKDKEKISIGFSSSDVIEATGYAMIFAIGIFLGGIALVILWDLIPGTPKLIMV